MKPTVFVFQAKDFAEKCVIRRAVGHDNGLPENLCLMIFRGDSGRMNWDAYESIEEVKQSHWNVQIVTSPEAFIALHKLI